MIIENFKMDNRSVNFDIRNNNIVETVNIEMVTFGHVKYTSICDFDFIDDVEYSHLEQLIDNLSGLLMKGFSE